jgi:hypothetical protein
VAACGALDADGHRMTAADGAALDSGAGV